MVNYFKDSDVNSWKDSDVNAWKISAFQIKTTVTTLFEMSYVSADMPVAVWEEPYLVYLYVIGLFNEIYGAPLVVVFDEPYTDVPKTVGYFSEYYFDTYEPLKSVRESYDDAFTPLLYKEEEYGDIPHPLQLTYLPYNNNPIVSKTLTLPYRDMLQPVNAFSSPYDIIREVMLIVEEEYAISDVVIKKYFEEIYPLEVYNKVQNYWDELYYLLIDNSYISTPTATVTVNGVAIDFIGINISFGLDKYCMFCVIDLPSENEYVQCNYLDDVVCEINGESYSFFIENKEKTESNESVSYALSLLSPTAKLDAPYSQTFIDSLVDGAYAQTLVEGMAALENITVDYQILNWFIPAHAISINDETPLSVIKKVVNAVGGIIQTKPNGEMLIISEYPDSPTQWDTDTPLVVFDKASDLLNISETTTTNTGYNAFVITDQGSSSASIFLREENIDDTTKVIKGFRVPFDDGEFDLETSGGVFVFIDKYQYPIEEQIPVVDTADDEWELVEFIDWVGNTTFPIYDIVDWDWVEEDLGDLDNPAEVQISENGTLSIVNQGGVPSESLLRIKYITKYWQWIVTAPTDADVQFFVPEEE